MKIEESRRIRDLKIIQPPVFHDFRGEYIETFHADRYRFSKADGSPLVFVEDDVSVSRRGVLRGLHGDWKTWKLIQCLYGAIYFVVADLRPDSTTYLHWQAFAVNDRNRQQILVPAGCANGHLCLTETCIFSYKQSEYYTGAADQFTVRWDDPRLGIWWPIRDPILSQRDSTAAFLA